MIEVKRKMKVLCKIGDGATEICCSVCAQGFVLYWERQTHSERAAALKEVARTLRSHHSRHAGPEAHPQRGFIVPEWNGPVAHTGANPGSAPPWAL
jgi:hypothetical protein